MSKSHWNYRVLAFDHKGEVFFVVHEVHYQDDIPKAYGATPARVCGETKLEMRQSLNRFKACMKQPTLWGGDRFPEPYKKPKQNE